MNIYSIDIPGGFSGTVEITRSKMHLERPETGGGYGYSTEIRVYHFFLLTPEKKSIEFYLLRFPDGEWCNTKNLYPPPQWGMDEELIFHTKAEVAKLGL